MESIKSNIKVSLDYIKTFFKWILIASAIGVVGGVLGSIFHICIDCVTDVRKENDWILYLLPVGGLAICALYSLAKKRIDTNRVIESIRAEKDVPWYMAPLIFVGTVITHFLGGSAGREGAALQLGGSIGYNVGKVLKLNKSEMNIIVMTGMSAVFTAMFGTPLTAAFFALEVTSVGIMYYAGLLPCIAAALVANVIAGAFGISPVRFELSSVPAIDFGSVAGTAALAVLCAIVCIIFCSAMKGCEHYAEKLIKNKYLRVAVGGAVIVALTLLVGNRDYNGAGMEIISRAIVEGRASPAAFALKIVFTAITISVGFKGGEIVPAFFIGSTFGCVVGGFLGLPPGFSAAVGFCALFCGLVNCPVASMLLAIEVFGAAGMEFFLLVCGISYMMSGNCGLYKSQKIMYSKLEGKFVGNKK